MRRSKWSSWLDKKMIGMKTCLAQKCEGMGTVEIILIIVVLIGLVIIFKVQITGLVEEIFDKNTRQSSRV